jgi:hypothetical protein
MTIVQAHGHMHALARNFRAGNPGAARTALLHYVATHMVEFCALNARNLPAEYGYWYSETNAQTTG